MNFSLEVGPHTDLDTLPPVKDVYVTMLPGGDYKETAAKSGDLVKKGFNPVPHFPARSILDEAQLKDYIARCKDVGAKQALVIGGSREPIGKFDSSIQILETGFFDGIKIGIAGHPEGSQDISDKELEKAMMDKKPYADYIVTQWLLDSQPNIVGAKNSINFLKSNFSKALDLLKPKDPNDLIGKVKEFTGNFHIYTFGGLKETNKWLKENGYV